MTLRTPQLGNFRSVIAVEHVNDFGIDSYNDGGTNGQTEYAVEADPSGTEVDELYVEYKDDSWQARYGRHYINLGPHPSRFVGTVGWRQNNQTFDGLSIDAKIGDSFRIEGAVIEKAYRLLGRDHPNRSAREWDLDGLGIHATVAVPNLGNLAGYYYNLDFDDNPALSTRTIGFMADGPCFTEGSGWSGPCKAAISMQSALNDAHGADELMHAQILFGVDFSNFSKDNTTGSIAFSATVLEGDGVYAFKTPLATLHGYAGAADKFLVHTPPAGLIDSELRIKERIFGWDTTIAVHRFVPWESLGPNLGSYGNELDFAATRTFGKYKWLVKAAHYHANEAFKPSALGLNATKFWVAVQFSL